MVDLNFIASQALHNAKIRAENNPEANSIATYEMLKHTASEVVEATEAYLDYTWQEQGKAHFADELADIICCVLIIAGNEQIDLESAVVRCLEKNRLRAIGKGDKK